MKVKVSGPAGALRLAGGPVLFTGTPPMLRAKVALVNTSGERLKVRGMTTVPAPPPGRKGRGARQAAAAASVVLGDVRLSATLDPGAAAHVPARLRVDRYTPAGRYTTALEVGGQEVEAVVQVFERDAVRFQPRPLYLRGVAGETLSQPMVVTNVGNVAHTLAPGGSVHLGEKDWLGRALVFALRETDVQHDHNQYLDQLFREVRATLPAPARFIMTAAGDGALPPGATLEVQMDVTLPDGLVKGRTYVGRTRFLGAALGFTVDCIGTARTVKRRAR